MTMLRHGPSAAVDQETVDRMVSALRLGLYHIAPMPDGIAAVDVHHETQRLTCDVVRRARGLPIPDVDMGASTRRWTDPESILPGGTGFERRAAFARRHAELAIAVLRASPVDDDEAFRIRERLVALAMTRDAPKEAGWAVTATAPTSWSPLVIERIPSRFSPEPEQPDPTLAATIPWIVSARLVDRPGERQFVRIDAFQAFISPGKAPDPMSVMRTLAEMRAEATP